MKKLTAFLLVIVSVLTLSSCGLTPERAMIDWVDFVRLNDISYESIGEKITLVPVEYIGEKLGEVTRNSPSEVIDPDKYEVQNGEASFLPIGTEIYAITDCDSKSYVAAKTDGDYRLYKTHDSDTISFADEEESESAKISIESISEAASSDSRQTTEKSVKSQNETLRQTAAVSVADKTGSRSEPSKGSADREISVTSVRFFGYDEGTEYPYCFFVDKAEQLKKVCTENDFKNKTEKYSDKFFEKSRLLLIALYESSGSISHAVSVVTNGDTVTAYINRDVPQVLTCDIAQWYIISELPKKAYSSVNVTIDGKVNNFVFEPGESSAESFEPHHPLTEDIYRLPGMIASDDPEYTQTPPVLQIETTDGVVVSVTQASMSRYTWTYNDSNGNKTTVSADGKKDQSDIAKIAYSSTDGKAKLILHGNVKSFTVTYTDPASSDPSSEKAITTDKSGKFELINSKSKTAYHYKICVEYEEGTACYSFLCD